LKQGLIVNDTALIAEFCCQSQGLAYLPEMEITNDLAAGQLHKTLTEFIPPTSGLYLCFPARTRRQAKLRAFIDLARAGNWRVHANY
jgi:DNA-binding transcriptional LysR family regulator